MAAEDEGHDLTPAGHGGFDADDVAELVDGEGTANGGAAVGRCAGELVEAVADGEVFHDVALVEDVGSRGGDGYFEEVGVLLGGLGDVGHLGEELAKLVGGGVETGAIVEVVDFGGGDAGLEGGSDAGEVVVVRNDFDGLDGEGLGAVHAEHGDEHVGDDAELGQVGGGDLDEDVGGVESDLGVLAVDDGGERADYTVGVVDDGVYGGVADDVQETTQVLVGFVEGHEFLARHFLGLVERDELDVLGGEGFVCEGALDGVEIVSSDGDERSVTSQVLVKLVLQGDEGLIAVLGELDVAKDGAGNERADLESLGRDFDDLLLAVLGFDNAEVGRGSAAEEDVEVQSNAFEAEHVVAVGGNLNLELGRLLDAIDDGALVLLGVFVELDAIIEAEVFKLLLGVSRETVKVSCGRWRWWWLMVGGGGAVLGERKRTCGQGLRRACICLRRW